MTNVIVRRPLKRSYIENMPYLGNTNLPVFRTHIQQNDMSNMQYGMRPAANITEDENKFIIEMAVPSFSKTEISIEIDNNILTVKGQKAENEDKTSTYHLKQYNVQTFRRSFRMPEPADTNTVEAAMKNGILTLSVAKIEKAAPKKIEIH